METNIKINEEHIGYLVEYNSHLEETDTSYTCVAGRGVISAIHPSCVMLLIAHENALMVKPIKYKYITALISKVVG